MKSWIRKSFDQALADGRYSQPKIEAAYVAPLPQSRAQKPRPRNTGIIDGTKVCAGCMNRLPLTEFYIHHHKASGRKHYATCCDPCRKRRMVVRRSGITEERFIEMIAASNGLCDICKLPYKKPSVDHSHFTGKPRGVLCVACNSAIGIMKDDPSRLRAAADYIERHANV